jgi:hypothetical protein
MQGINAQSLNLPNELFELLKDSVIVGRIGHSFTIKQVKEGFMRGRVWVTNAEYPYLQINSQPVQIGEVKDLGLNSLLYLMQDQFEYVGIVDGKYRFVKPYKEFSEAELAVHNASAGNSITYSPEQIVDIIDTPEGETLVHHYGEEQYLRKAVKDKVSGIWTWQVIMTKENAMALPVVPANIRIFNKKQLDRWKDNTLTSEQFDSLCFEERKLVDIDLATDVANVFTEVAETEDGKIGLAVYFNGLTPQEKPLSEYTARPTGWWSRGFRIEWRLFNEQPLPEVLTDGVYDMRDTAASLSEIGNMGMVARVYFDMDNDEGYFMNVREIEESEVPHYNAETKTFVYDPSKKAIVQGSIRVLPIVGGKEATHECSIDLNTKEVFRF